MSVPVPVAADVVAEQFSQGVGVGVGLTMPGVSTSPAKVASESAKSRQRVARDRFMGESSNYCKPLNAQEYHIGGKIFHMPITDTHSGVDRGQLERKELARTAWRDGNPESALLIIDSVLAEEMSPQVAAECYSAKAGFQIANKDFDGATESLERMAPFLEVADIRIRGTFYLQRGRVHRQQNNIDAALTDYTGALAFWQMCGDKQYEGAAYINLAECYFRINDLEQAYLNIEKAFAVLPEGSEYLCNAYDTKAKILLADGRAEQAYSLIEKALALSGGNELWEKGFLETKEKIKTRLMEMLIPLAKIGDLENIKLQMVHRALRKTDGSIRQAADMLGTSRQALTYIADHNGLKRLHRKKSIIKHLN